MLATEVINDFSIVFYCYKEKKVQLKNILLIVFVSVSGLVHAQPINDLDEFQAKIEKCITGSTPDTCLNKLLPSRFPPGNEQMLKTIGQVTSLLVKWLGDDKVYAIHPIKTTKAGNLHERRVFVIEADKGAFMVLDTAYLRFHGELYLFNFNLSSRKEKIEALFEGKL
jgi:hypothetical protein